MKYCVSGRQQKVTLEKADEIKMQYKDKDRLINYIEDYKDKTFILEIPKEEQENIDWPLLNVFKEKTQNFILAIQDLNLANEIYEKGFKFYWNYPIFTWYELEGVAAFSPSYLYLGPPLSFSLEKIKMKYNILIRLCANLAYDAYIPRENGICGSWIRPEDIEVYDKWADAIEFITDDLGKEATLLHIYKENKSWPGNLNLLITNLNYNIDNRGIPEEFGEIRANCGQRCMSGERCNFCNVAFNFTTSLRKLHYNLKKLN